MEQGVTWLCTIDLNPNSNLLQLLYENFESLCLTYQNEWEIEINYQEICNFKDNNQWIKDKLQNEFKNLFDNIIFLHNIFQQQSFLLYKIKDDIKYDLMSIPNAAVSFFEKANVIQRPKNQNSIKGRHYTLGDFNINLGSFHKGKKNQILIEIQNKACHYINIKQKDSLSPDQNLYIKEIINFLLQDIQLDNPVKFVKLNDKYFDQFSLSQEYWNYKHRYIQLWLAMQ